MITNALISAIAIFLAVGTLLLRVPPSFTYYLLKFRAAVDIILTAGSMIALTLLGGGITAVTAGAFMGLIISLSLEIMARTKLGHRLVIWKIDKNLSETHRLMNEGDPSARHKFEKKISRLEHSLDKFKGELARA